MTIQPPKAATTGQKGIGSHQSARSLKDEWLTPPAIIEATGPYDLDPCSPIVRPWKTAAHHYTIEDDGLSRLWHGTVWCNPPYGRQTWVWLSRLAEHGDGVALVFARTETAGFAEEVWGKADSLLFLHGRLHFHHGDGTRARANAGAPSVLIAYGANAVERLVASGLEGSLMRTWL